MSAIRQRTSFLDNTCTLDLIVRADTWDSAEQILKTAGASPVFEANDNKLQGYRIAKYHTAKTSSLSDIYKNISKSDTIAILDDHEYGRINREAVLRYISVVENKLRLFLVYAHDQLEMARLMKKGTRTKSYEKNGLIREGLSGHLISELTFDELLRVLSSNNGLEGLTISDLGKLLEDASSLAKLKIKINEANTTVWDVLSRRLLETPISWQDVEKDLQILKEHRNNAAHFKPMSERESIDAKKTCVRFNRKTKLKSPHSLSQAESSQLGAIFDSLYKSVNTSTTNFSDIIVQRAGKVTQGKLNTPISTAPESALNSLLGRTPSIDQNNKNSV